MAGTWSGLCTGEGRGLVTWHPLEIQLAQRAVEAEPDSLQGSWEAGYSGHFGVPTLIPISPF